MKCLFIGGPAAGRIVEVDLTLSNVRIPYRCDESGFSDLIYHRFYVRDLKGETHSVFIQRDTDGEIEDPLVTLMNFYAEAKHP